MKPERALYFLTHVKYDLERVLDSLGMKYYFLTAAYNKSENCLLFEIETTHFKVEFLDYIRDFADEVSVHFSSNGVCVFKMTYSLV